MVNNSKRGRLNAIVAIKAASSAAPLLVSWVLLGKKPMKWWRLWGKSNFSVLHVGLGGSLLSFLVITMWSSLLAKPPSSTFVLLRDMAGISYSATESPGRSFTSPQLWAVWHPVGKGGTRTIWGSAQQQPREEQGVSRSSWVPAQGVSWESWASTWQQIPQNGVCWAQWSLPQYSFIYSSNFSQHSVPFPHVTQISLNDDNMCIY